MDANEQLLEYIYKNAKMGVDSLLKLMDTIRNKDNKIKGLIEDNIKEYQRFVDESENLLKENKIEPKEIKKSAKTSSSMVIKMEMMRDNSDSHIADMLLKGSTMGIVEIEKEINNFVGKADKKIINLAKELLEHEKKNTDKIKEFL